MRLLTHTCLQGSAPQEFSRINEKVAEGVAVRYALCCFYITEAGYDSNFSGDEAVSESGRLG